MCQTSFFKRNKMTNEPESFPCGKCPECVSRRTSGWSFRLMQEDKMSDSSMFITLTYATEHVPFTKNGFMDLSGRDLQLFFKRLRKCQKGDNCKPIKYYAVGEYGGDSERPHYHIILFNAQIESIQLAWQLGQVHYGDVTGASVGYTLKYISKPWRPMHVNDDRTPQFARQSKGLGASYLANPAVVEWHKTDLENRMYVPLLDGKKASMPRYYKDKLYTETERKRIAHFTKLKVNAKLNQQLSQNPNHWAEKASKDKQSFKKMAYRSKQTSQKV